MAESPPWKFADDFMWHLPSMVVFTKTRSFRIRVYLAEPARAAGRAVAWRTATHSLSGRVRLHPGTVNRNGDQGSRRGSRDAP
jgi:hypothetical protein